MNWPMEYLCAILAGDEVVSRKIHAVYKRETEWMKNPPESFPFYFDEDAGQRPIDFVETFCRHSKGRWGRQPVRLELFQRAKFQLAYGWKYKDTGLRRIHEVADIRGRKCGKSTETAGIELYSLIADGENGPEVYCTANKKDQAGIVFGEAVNMRSQSEAIRAITKKRQGDIYFPAMFGTIKPLAAEVNTMDGLNAHFFSQDEWHEARNSGVYDVMKQSQSAREQPMAWLISTFGFVREMFFDSQYSLYSKIATWEPGYQDYSILPLIYELDDRKEWTDPKCWPKANPGLGSIKSYAMLAGFVERAKRDPKFLPTVMTKDFNIPENSAETWLSYDIIVNETTVDMEYLRHSYAIAGCDLSAVRDLTCATLLIRKPDDNRIFALQHYFIPESKIAMLEATNNREAPYRLWAEQKYLTICPGATVNYHDVTMWYVTMVKDFDIRPLWVCYDAALSGYWVPEMEEYGFDMDNIRQGPFTWSYPMKNMAGALEDKLLIYQNNPITRWCLLNTGVKTLNKDGIQTIQPVKTGENKRIDGMVSMLNAWVGYEKRFAEYMPYVR